MNSKRLLRPKENFPAGRTRAPIHPDSRGGPAHWAGTGVETIRGPLCGTPFYVFRLFLPRDWLAEAVKVFRADLERNPRNPRSLLGLWQSLAAQKKDADAAWVRTQFDAASKVATVKFDLARDL